MTTRNNIKGTTVSFPLPVSVKDLKLMVEGNAILSGKKPKNAVIFSPKADGTAQVPAALPKQQPGKQKK